MNDNASLRGGLRWAHYAIEAWGLGTFMVVAGSVAVALNVLPPSSALWLLAHPLGHRAIFGAAMGLTSALIVYSVWGARSGAHINPAMTLTFAALGKIRARDALFYSVAQFAGAAAGLALVAWFAGPLLVGPPSHSLVTKPGPAGIPAAFIGEVAATFVLMSLVLAFSNAPPRIARFTGLAACVAVALAITFESPLSGTSLNPARTLASALQEHDWTAIRVYFTAPPLGMLLAALAYVKLLGADAVLCARLNHSGPQPCPFRCTYAQRYADARSR